ncbi:hypothetical protein N658DRAFT_270913 [Parathielavia hyrcaniae]|uniref:Uncharacterized protein n=1 Tax=Parathielavia hyrcaniae TaxID=113614 RepID=A0AAN6PY90_9PEZI|nr:hypothetical protein N658DRAFT_270913 [Parathielavia hyrcaniae]
MHAREALRRPNFDGDAVDTCLGPFLPPPLLQAKSVWLVFGAGNPVNAWVGEPP